MFCQKCGSEIPDDANVCPSCGALRDGMKFCQHCGQAIDTDCVVCPKCGKQVSELKQAQPQPPQVIINNSNNNTSTATATAVAGGVGRMKDKWVAFFLCLFLGGIGAHKFYEGKTGLGILYICTVGLFGIGWFVDLITLLLKPNPYFV